MNTEPLRQSLVRAARRAAPSDAVPPFFAARVRAAIRALEPDPAAHWVAGLWRAALCSVCVAVVAGAVLAPFHHPAADAPDAGDAELAELAVPDLPEADLPAAL